MVHLWRQYLNFVVHLPHTTQEKLLQILLTFLIFLRLHMDMIWKDEMDCRAFESPIIRVAGWLDSNDLVAIQ